jgi:hypothetical protein
MKQTRKVLETLAKWQCVDGVTQAQCAHCVARVALVEVEAIEEAARAWRGHERPENMRTVDELMTAIAKDAP